MSLLTIILASLAALEHLYIFLFGEHQNYI